jgi:hypothetical protein
MNIILEISLNEKVKYKLLSIIINKYYLIIFIFIKKYNKLFDISNIKNCN